MSTWRVGMSTVVTVTVEVEADDVDAAIELALDQGPPELCVHCSGYRQSWSRDEIGCWEPDHVERTGAAGTAWTSGERWTRTEPPR